jgi:hypothetical protein
MPLSISNPNLISASGDIAISGGVSLTLASDVLADLSAHGPGRAYEIISFPGTGNAYQTTIDANGIVLPDYTKPIPDCNGVALCTVPGFGASGPNLAALLGPAFNNVFPVAQRIGKSIFVRFINPSSGGAMGPDFNGDGVVNALDLAIWQANVGITIGASVLQGDADGDGDVDGDDFLIWQSNLGPYPGAGSGTGTGLGAAPEPTGLALLLVGGLFATAVRRQRRPC